ncbi:hypothetical protein CQZ99_08585 [Pseudomonas poae]|uniref:Uncharacterized protein n=1 Tax=Pseudomonas poae TaxID=200451 RepID=A0A2S9EV32_9PSED|nr:hypothetical protein CQZ97_13460 [Pseudomonas poae]PRC20031.1 hypothetical protein CQZ99_08585 [Pseudomonas poae]
MLIPLLTLPMHIMGKMLGMENGFQPGSGQGKQSINININNDNNNNSSSSSISQNTNTVSLKGCSSICY